MENLHPEIRIILDAAAGEMIARSSQPVHFQLDLSSTIALIGNLQLAFRHPVNVGNSRQQMETFVRDLIEQIDPEHGSLYQVLMMGFESDFDC